MALRVIFTSLCLASAAFAEVSQHTLQSAPHDVTSLVQKQIDITKRVSSTAAEVKEMESKADMAREMAENYERHALEDDTSLLQQEFEKKATVAKEEAEKFDREAKEKWTAMEKELELLQKSDEKVTGSAAHDKLAASSAHVSSDDASADANAEVESTEGDEEGTEHMEDGEETGSVTGDEDLSLLETDTDSVRGDESLHTLDDDDTVTSSLDEDDETELDGETSEESDETEEEGEDGERVEEDMLSGQGDEAWNEEEDAEAKQQKDANYDPFADYEDPLAFANGPMLSQMNTSVTGEHATGGLSHSAEAQGQSFTQIGTETGCKDGVVMTGPESFCAHVTDEELGKGTSAKVRTGFKELPDGKPFPLAVKLNDLSKSKDRFSNEVDVMVNLLQASEHIVKLYGFNKEKRTLAMEHLTGGSLWSQRKNFPLSNDDAKKVMRQVVIAVNDCHKNRVAHRDIKEEQFVFANDISHSLDSGYDTTLKLLDFGHAVKLEGNATSGDSASKEWDDLVGSFPYMAPEVAKNNLNKAEKSSFSVYQPDVWSTGVMAYQLSTGKMFISELFNTVNKDKAHGKPSLVPAMRALEKVTDADILQLIQKEKTIAGTDTANFILKALKVAPDERATSSELLMDHWLISA